MKNLSELNIGQVPGLVYECSCGKTHTVEIDNIEIGSGVVNKIPDIIKNYEGKNIFIVEDVHTFEVAGKKVEYLLQDKFKVKRYIFQEEHLLPNELSLGRLIVEIPKDTDLVVAVGSGTINDLSRFLSYKVGVPYVIVGTAPSMDGYASVVSPLVLNGVKVTYDAIYPRAIIADLDIMKNAPMQMLQAGLGDVIGKYTALADWDMANLINCEYICDEVKGLVMKSVKKCEEASVNLGNRKAEVIENMTEALVLSGIAIGMVGASRPASGSEHQISHCYEMIFMSRGLEEKWLHGNTVGIGVGIAAYAYKYAGKLNIDKIIEKQDYINFDRDIWVKNITDVYMNNAKNIIEFKQDSINFDKEKRKLQMDKIKSKWNDIKEICTHHVPDPDKIINILKSSGCVWNPRDIGIDKELFIKSVIAAKDMRKRYGIFQLLEDIGELKNAAEYAAEIYYN